MICPMASAFGRLPDAAASCEAHPVECPDYLALERLDRSHAVVDERHLEECLHPGDTVFRAQGRLFRCRESGIGNRCLCIHGPGLHLAPKLRSGRFECGDKCSLEIFDHPLTGLKCF